MLSSTKWIVVIVIMSGSTIGVLEYRHRIKSKELNDSIYELQRSSSRLEERVKIQNQADAEYQKSIIQLTADLQKANKKTQEALDELSKAVKPIPVPPIEDEKEIIAEIKNYGDAEASYMNNRFSVHEFAMSGIMTDAFNWKTTYPLFNTLVDKNDAAVQALKSEGMLKDKMITEIKASNNSLVISNNLKDANLTDNNRLIKDLNVKIKSDEETNKIKKIIWGAIGAAVGLGLGSLK